jgi:N-acetylglucosaminyl-diphospho-decaprenol L-rhamnosyltransferase
MKRDTSRNRIGVSGPIDLSIIIVNFETRALLHQCVQSILDTTDHIDLEIIVVDNGSKDGSTAMVQSCFPDIRLIRNDKNLGFSAACNQGLGIMRGAYACLLNPDALVCKGAFDHMLDFMKANQRIGALGCKLLDANKTQQPSCFRFYTLKTVLFDYCLLPRRLEKTRLVGAYKPQGLAKPARVDWVQGACFVISASALEEVGLLDEDFFIYSEEVDWCYRAWQKGWEVWFTPKAAIIHYGAEASKQQDNPALLELYKSRYRFWLKHHGLYAACMLRLLVLMATVWNSLFLFLRFLLKRIKGKQLLKEVDVYWRIAIISRP